MPSPDRPPPPDHPLPPDRPLPPGLTTAAIGLFAARILLPAESAAGGGTILIAAAWLLLGVVALGVRLRNRAALSLDAADVAVAAVTLPPAVAGFAGLVRAVDQRAAVNLAWEWLALGVSAWLLRRLLVRDADRRRAIAAVIGVTTAAAAHGLYQHFVWYPATAAEFTEFERLSDLPSPTAAEQQQLRRLTQSLGPDVLSMSDSSRAAIRQRLVNSTEPLGFFALANTMGGVLAAVGCFVVASLVRKTPGWPVRLAVAIVVGVTLLLTKSRTAVVAVLVASIMLLVVSRVRVPRQVVVTVVGGLLLVGTILIVAGGIDAEVITESPKSLRYRLEYWSGAAGVIRDSPFVGTAPGGFRAAYLKHKLPGASEEILDPHNWLLEAWATGGFLVLLAVIAGLGWGTVRLLQKAGLSEAGDATGRLRGRVVPPVLIAAAVALLVGGFPVYLDGSLLVAGVVATLVAAVGRWQWTDEGLRLACLATSLTLTIHLLGAGGYAMPAVMQLWLAALFVLPRPASRAVPLPRWVTPSLLAATALAAVACVVTGVRANVARESLMNEATYAATFEGDLTRAAGLLADAAEVDRLSAEPLIRLAGVQQAAGRDDAAADAAAEAVQRDPRSPTLRQWQADILRQAGRPQDTLASLRLAAAGYPNSASIRADLAIALAERRGPDLTDARSEAAAALQLDDLNRAAGHADKVLAENVRRRIETIADGGRP